MTTIPDIQFFKSQKSKYGFETFSIDSIYNRNKNINNKIWDYHRLKFYTILHVSDGESEHYVDFKKHKIKKGDIIFIAKEQIQAYAKHKTIKGNIIIFTEDFLTKNLSTQDISAYFSLFNYQLSSPVISIPDNKQDHIKYIIDSLNNEMIDNDEFLKENLLRYSLRILLLKCVKSLGIKSPIQDLSHYTDFFTFQKLVTEQFGNTHNAKDFAEIMNISYKHLNDICKEFTTKTAKSFIDDYIILEAKRQLSVMNTPIKTIAYNTGFEEITNFTKFFKKKTNRTPKAFRESL